MEYRPIHKRAAEVLAACWLLGMAAQPGLAQQVDANSAEFFETKIRPTLAGTCFKCHGGEKVSSGLRVDSRKELLEGGERGPAVLPGNADESPLIEAIRHGDESLHMPPDGRLSDQVVADFTAWVERGAPWPEYGDRAFESQAHWAFQPIQRPAPPADPTGWSDQAIDRFVIARLREQGLVPAGPADRRTLIRRAYFDLIGLPPEVNEVEDFVSDPSPGAFARVVDKLLASPHYGERWGRFWMDVVRYADTAGDNADYPIPEGHLYRDYIIDSLNADKPYDEFIQEQLAGDILARQGPAERYAERVAATGFIALTRRYATAPFELWHLSVEDSIDTTGRAFLGLTLRCARCHDHKFDPVTNKDYYALYGFFASTRYPFAGSEELHSKSLDRSGFVPLLPPDQAQLLLSAYEERIRGLASRIAELPESDPELPALKAELKNLKRRGTPAGLPVAYAVAEGQPTDVAVQIRGDPQQSGPVVARGAPAFLTPQPLEIPDGTSGRLELARWLTDPANPLTARVMANRIWQHHFGRGIVATPSNFGLSGEPPTHPELLDWLAAALIDRDWRIKPLHRMLMLSRTYQLASDYHASNAAIDPGNRWLWQWSRRRLDAEAIRDSMLWVSGNLDTARPGPHPFPPIESWSWTQHSPFKDVYDSNCRSVYLMTQRIQRHPFLALFDGPDANSSIDVRTSATVPGQALYMMNHPFVTQQSRDFASRLIAADSDTGARIDLAHRMAWGRAPRDDERQRARSYLADYANELQRHGLSADQSELECWSSLARVILMSNEFLYID